MFEPMLEESAANTMGMMRKLPVSEYKNYQPFDLRYGPKPRDMVFDPKVIANAYTDMFRKNPHLDPKLISQLHETESLANFVRKLKR